MTISLRVSTFEKNNSGTNDIDQTITGVGFTPKVVIFTGFSVSPGSYFGSYIMYFGLDAGPSNGGGRFLSIYGQDATTPTITATRWHTAYSLMKNATNSTNTTSGAISSFNSDGYVMHWDLNDTSGNQFQYLALGGGDITNVRVGHFNAPNSTGEHSVTGVGFEPDFVLLIGTNRTTDDSWIDTQASSSYGFFNKNGEQAVSSVCIVDNLSTSDTSRYQRVGDRCLAMYDVTDASTLTHEAAFVSMNSDGFTLNYSTASVANKRVAYLAIKGIKTKIGSFTSPTSGATPVSQTINTVGFLAKGFLFSTVGKTVGTSIVPHARHSLGFAQNSTNRNLHWGGYEDNSTSPPTADRQDHDQCIRVSDEQGLSTNTTTQALADFSSIESNGFTLSWDVRDTANAYETIYVAFGEAGTLFERSVNETVSVDATSDIHRNISRGAAANLFINDTVAKKLTAFRTVATLESLTVSGIVTRFKTIPRSVAESFTVVDNAVTRFFRANKIVSESATIVDDAVDIWFSITRSLSESVIVQETVSAARQFKGIVNESLTIVDAVTRFFRANRTVPESFTVSDNVAIEDSIGRGVAESLTITDVMDRGVNVIRNVAESLTIISDAVGNRVTFLSRSVSESLAIAEDGFAEICNTAGQLKEIIIHKLGRFFSVLPQRNIRAYTFDSEIIGKKDKETLG